MIKYSGGVPAGIVDRALEAAIHAPNHFLNEPWRFRILGKATKAKIIALNEAKKELFEPVPGWMLVTLVPTAGDEKWNPKALEDHAACACAVQNFMLSLASEGYGSKWMTGAMGSPAAKIMEACGADDSKEHFMGVIFYGRPATPSEPPQRAAPPQLAAPPRLTAPPHRLPLTLRWSPPIVRSIRDAGADA